MPKFIREFVERFFNYLFGYLIDLSEFKAKTLKFGAKMREKMQKFSEE
jgi:hypothetical protein